MTSANGCLSQGNPWLQKRTHAAVSAWKSAVQMVAAQRSYLSNSSTDTNGGIAANWGSTAQSSASSVANTEAKDRSTPAEPTPLLMPHIEEEGDGQPPDSKISKGGSIALPANRVLNASVQSAAAVFTPSSMQMLLRLRDYCELLRCGPASDCACKNR